MMIAVQACSNPGARTVPIITGWAAVVNRPPSAFPGSDGRG
jgi:hypothetical protein